jgi:hypothetical protein
MRPVHSRSDRRFRPEDVNVDSWQTLNHLAGRVARHPQAATPVAEYDLGRQRLVDVVDQSSSDRPAVKMDSADAR